MSNFTGFSIFSYLSGTGQGLVVSAARYAGNDVVLTTLVDGFSIFYPASRNGLLPVELLSFSGIDQPEGNLLRWSTASEINSSFFELERSQNARDWTPIANVNAKGFSNDRVDYEFLDTAPPDQAYYRLRMVDLDGSFEYSPIAFVDRKTTAEDLTIIPNPTENMVFLSAPKGPIRLFDLQGRLLQEIALSSTVSLQNHPAGTYILRVGEQVFRVVKK